MLDAFADGEDVGIAGAHVVEHGDAAPNLQTRRLGKVDIRSNADSKYDQIGRNEAAIGELHAFAPVGTGDLFGLAVGEEGNAAAVERFLQHLTGRHIELPLH